MTTPFEQVHGPFDEIPLNYDLDNVSFDDLQEFYGIQKADESIRVTRPEFELLKKRLKDSWDLKYVVADLAWKGKYALAGAFAVAGGVAAAEYAAGEFEDAQFALQENTEGVSVVGPVWANG